MKTFLALGILLTAAIGLAANWPAWRPFDGSGASMEKQAPLKWTATNNIRWKTALPERGNSSPVVWNNRIYLTQAHEKDQQRLLYCFDRSTGEQLWRAGIKFDATERTHESNPYGSSSPATDGTNIFVWFGSAGLFCFNSNAREMWRKDLGRQDHEWGYGSSPVLYSNLCILYFGPGENSAIWAMDKATGKTVWKREFPPRASSARTDGFAGRTNGVIGSWSTPIIVNAGGTNELIVSLPEKLEAFDPMTGQTLWTCQGLNPLIYTSPIYGDGVVVAMGGFLGSTIAVKVGGRGDVTATHRLWQQTKTKNRLGSGLVYDRHIYILNSDGIAECLELETGKRLWEERAAGSGTARDSWSSMLRVGERIYVLNQAGETAVLRASPKFELLAFNPLDGTLSNSSHAVSDGQIFIRTHSHLWCIANPEKRVSTR